MNREELPQEASREDKMRDALKHYEELATKACWHRSDIPEAIRAYYAPLPPAEGAEQRIRVRNILQDFYRRGEYELEQAEEDIMRLFQPQPTAEGAEEITAEEFIREKIRQKFYVKGEMLGLWTYLCNGEDALRLVHEFATLHAQRIAEKMVSERLREELMRYDQWLLANDMGQMFDDTMKCVDEYLKASSHD